MHWKSFRQIWGSNLKFVYSIYGIYWNARDGRTVEHIFQARICGRFLLRNVQGSNLKCWKIHLIRNPKISGTSLISTLGKSSKVRASSILTTWSLSLLLAFYCGRVTRFNKFSQPGPLRLDHLIYPLPPAFSMLGAILILNYDISWFIFQDQYFWWEDFSRELSSNGIYRKGTSVGISTEALFR